jgi:hypothetical protein
MGTSRLSGPVLPPQRPSLRESTKRLYGRSTPSVDANEISFSNGNANVLHDLVRLSQPWGTEGVAVPRGLRGALWTLIPIELAWGIWLLTIVSGANACDGPICTVATLNSHATVLLVCAAINIVGLVALIPFTRGLSRCNTWQVAGLALAATAGCIALLGIAAVILGATIVMVTLAVFLLAFTATSGREMEDARPRTPFPIAVPRVGTPTRAHRAEPPS